MTDPTHTTETVSSSAPVWNPVLVAAGGLLTAVGVWLAHGGAPTANDVQAIGGAVLALIPVALLAWRSWHNASKAKRIAANPANVAVSLKP